MSSKFNLWWSLLLISSLCPRVLVGSSSSSFASNSAASFYGAGTRHLINTHPSNSLHVCLQFTIASQGILLSASTTNNSFVFLTLIDASVVASIQGHQEHSVTLPLSQSQATKWLTTELTVSPSQFSLSLAEAKTQTNLSQPLNFTGEVYLGGDTQGTHSPYIGCIANLNVNSQSMLFSEDGFHVGCCIPPLRAPTMSLGTYNSSLWDGITITAQGPTLNEGSEVTISDAYFEVEFPEALINSNTSYWFKTDLEKRIAFEISEQPSWGYFSRGLLTAPINYTTYSELESSDQHAQVVYNHGGHGGDADSAIFRAHFICEDGGPSPWSQDVSFPIDIIVLNQPPYIANKQTIHMAIGTRIVLTPEIITVKDNETNASNIHYTQEFVAAMAVCDLCQNELRGQFEHVNAPGREIRFFDQSEIDKGIIAFQHFSKYGNEAVSIGLRVRDSGGKHVHPIIDVSFFQGNLDFTPKESLGNCIFLTSSKPAILSQDYYSTTTNFAQQNPIIAYHMIEPMKHGIIEVFRPELRNWYLVNVNATGLGEAGFFTQAEVDSGYVRYTSTTTSDIGVVDVLYFNLASSQFFDERRHFACFHILVEESLIKPEFKISSQPIELDEDGIVLITKQNIDVRIDNQDVLYSPDGIGIDITVEDLEPIFLIDSAPSEGVLLVDNQSVEEGGNFSLSDLLGGLIYYNHTSGNEVHSDSFSFTLMATVDVALLREPEHTNFTVDISLTPVNDNPPLFQNESDIYVTEGSSVVVRTENILVTDADLPGNDLDIRFRKPRPDREEEIQTGYFSFASNNEEIRSCTMADVIAERLVFYHTLDESAHLEFLQTLRISDGVKEHIIRPQVRVIAVPHNLMVDVLSDSPDGCLSELDLLDSFIGILDHAHFSFSMRDRFGNDPNLVDMVNVTILEEPTNGVLFKVWNNTNEMVRRFTVSDLKMNRIRYNFTSSMLHSTTSDSFTLKFTYGHSLVGPITIPVCIKPIPVIDYVLVKDVNITQEGLSDINTAHLWANNTRGESGDHVYYRIHTLPSYGIILLANSELSLNDTFTQTDLNNGVVDYSRTIGSGRDSDSVSLLICTTNDACQEPVRLELILSFVDITVVNTGVHVLEGELVTIDEDLLSGTAPPGSSEVRFKLLTVPEHGTLRLTYGSEVTAQNNISLFDMEDILNHRLSYEHDHSENFNDNFHVRIFTLINNNQQVKVLELVKISIEPVNDHEPVFLNNNKFEVAYLGTVQITSRSLSASDGDTNQDPRDLVFEVISPLFLYGYFYLEDEPEVRLSSWTQGDIIDGRLFYRHTDEAFDDEEDPQFVKIKDSFGKESAVDIIRAEIRDIIFVPVPGSTDKKFLVSEGNSSIISSDFLNYRASNDNLDPDKIEFTISDITSNGILFFNGSEVSINDTFNQQHVADGLLVYQHDHSNTFSDRFTFTLSDVTGRGGTDTFRFDIDIMTIDDDPPQVEILRDVLVKVRQAIIISSDVIQISDTDTIGDDDTAATDDIVCTIIQGPKVGHLEKILRGQNWAPATFFTKYDVDIMNFRYESLVSVASNDSFTFNVTDGRNRNPLIYRVNIYLLPEILTLVPELLQFTVEEGETILIQESFFSVEHSYLSTVPGTITIFEHPMNGHFNNTLTGEFGLSSFTTAQLENKEIFYVHNGEENLADQFTFKYTSHDPQNNDRTTKEEEFEITVAPNNDQVPVLSPYRLDYLEIWIGETRPLDQLYFNATDNDTPSNFLRYYIDSPSDGYLAYSNDTAIAITTFTQAEVDDNKISFVHHSDTQGKILYNVSDGDFIASGLFTYDAEPLTVHCNEQSCRWNPVAVNQSGMVLLRKEHLCCTTNDRTQNRSIIYHIISAKHGQLYMGDLEINDFDMNQLEAGLISYRHTDLDRWNSLETIVLDVSSELDAIINDLQFNISISLPSVYGKPAINSGLFLDEGETACLSIAALEARNVRYDAYLSAPEGTRLEELVIQYSLSELPRRGKLTVRGEELTQRSPVFTHADLVEGSVYYTHDNSESTSDSFEFTLLITGPSFQRQYNEKDFVRITIRPINDIRPSLMTTQPAVELVEGFNHVLTQDDLFIHDADSPSENISIFILSLPGNAKLFLDNEPLSEGGYFTQLNIIDGRVMLKPTEVSSKSSFSFFFTDEDTTSPSSIAHFNVTVVMHRLEALGSHKITYNQDDTSVMITKEFIYSKTNGDKSKTVYEITDHPMDGKFVLRTDVEATVELLDRISMFTHEDIDSERVWYVPLSKRGHRDQVSMRIRSSNLSLSNEQVTIHSMVTGEIRQDIEASFNEKGSFFQLPADLINSTEINPNDQLVVLEEPTYGTIGLRFDKKRKRSLSSFNFHYDDLLRGWAYYYWDPKEPITEEEVIERFTLLVNQSDKRPGEAFIVLTIRLPPVSTELPTDATIVPTTTPSMLTEDPTESHTGFPEVVVFLIVGMIVVLGVMFLVVVGFCVIHKKRIGSKIHRHLSPIPQRTIRESPSISPSRHIGQHYNFEPSNRIESELDHHSISSGFSEDEVLPPLRSPLRSPSHSQAFNYNPPYSGQPSPAFTSHRPLPRMHNSRNRVTSQTSIAFHHQGRQSSLSQVSNEEYSRNYSHSLPRHHAELAVPIPLRPASQQAYKAVRGESGYNSYPHTAQNSHLTSHSSVAPEESSLVVFPSALDYEDVTGLGDHVTDPEDHMTDLEDHMTDPEDHVTKLKPANGRVPDHVLSKDQEFNMLLSNIQKQFRQPVVGKKEYWL